MATQSTITELVCIDRFSVTPVRLELMLLAKQRAHPNLKLEIVESIYQGEPVLDIMVGPEQSLIKFYRELERLEDLVTTPLDEPVLDDDHLIHAGYWYVFDGVAEMCDSFTGWHGEGVSAGEFKKRFKIKEIRRCDLVGRELRSAPRKPEPPKVPVHEQPGRWNANGTHINQASRKPRNSRKIKKVK